MSSSVGMSCCAKPPAETRDASPNARGARARGDEPSPRLPERAARGQIRPPRPRARPRAVAVRLREHQLPGGEGHAGERGCASPPDPRARSRSRLGRRRPTRARVDLASPSASRFCSRAIPPTSVAVPLTPHPAPVLAQASPPRESRSSRCPGTPPRPAPRPGRRREPRRSRAGKVGARNPVSRGTRRAAAADATSPADPSPSAAITERASAPPGSPPPRSSPRAPPSPRRASGASPVESAGLRRAHAPSPASSDGARRDRVEPVAPARVLPLRRIEDEQRERARHMAKHADRTYDSPRRPTARAPPSTRSSPSSAARPAPTVAALRPWPSPRRDLADEPPPPRFPSRPRRRPSTPPGPGAVAPPSPSPPMPRSPSSHESVRAPVAVDVADEDGDDAPGASAPGGSGTGERERLGFGLERGFERRAVNGASGPSGGPSGGSSLRRSASAGSVAARTRTTRAGPIPLAPRAPELVPPRGSLPSPRSRRAVRERARALARVRERRGGCGG